MISRCNSPIPEMMIWPVSSSVLTRNEGIFMSEFAGRRPSFPDRLWSLALRPPKSPDQEHPFAPARFGLFRSHKVSPVVMSFRPIAAAMSPARTSLISSRLFACICTRRPIRSFRLFDRVIDAVTGIQYPGVHTKNVNAPTNGSVAILNAKCREWRFIVGGSLFGRLSRLPARPLIAATSVGAGNIFYYRIQHRLTHLCF